LAGISRQSFVWQLILRHTQHQELRMMIDSAEIVIPRIVSESDRRERQ
jgi:hypothetical protein